MNGDVLSDLLLALVSLGLAWRLMARRPGVAVAMSLIGLAAVAGMLRYGGIDLLLGPHRFLSLVAASAGLPLLAASRLWPDAPVATRLGAAGRYAILVGGIGVLCVAVLHIAFWGDLAAAVAALAILFAAWQARSRVGLAAGAALAIGFACSAAGFAAGPVDAVQALHVFMAMSLALMGWEEVRAANSRP